MTKEAFENALTVVMALGGSTNAVLHLLAMSRAAGIPLDLEDFQRISDKTPFIADLRPSGKYMMEDLHNVGLLLCLAPRFDKRIDGLFGAMSALQICAQAESIC